jgi:hypothetical protein
MTTLVIPFLSIFMNALTPDHDNSGYSIPPYFYECLNARLLTTLVTPLLPIFMNSLTPDY